MNQRATDLAKILDSFARIIMLLDEAQLESILSGNFRIEIIDGSIKPKLQARKPTRTARQAAASEVNDAVDKLRSSSTIEEGERLLHGRTKKTLISVAKHVSVRVSKGDDMPTVIAKIVQQTIGQRISREAIRGDLLVTLPLTLIQPQAKKVEAEDDH